MEDEATRVLRDTHHQVTAKHSLQLETQETQEYDLNIHAHPNSGLLMAVVFDADGEERVRFDSTKPVEVMKLILWYASPDEEDGLKVEYESRLHRAHPFAEDDRPKQAAGLLYQIFEDAFGNINVFVGGRDERVDEPTELVND